MFNDLFRARRVSRFRRQAFRPCLEAIEDRLLLTTYLVTTANDAGAGSLRQAILDANANSGPDAIEFGIGSGVQTISPTTALPTVTDLVSIDGTTQPGLPGAPRIVLNGAQAGANANGLVITAGESTVRGLVIQNFRGSGIVLQTGGGNVVAGNFIGTNAFGTAPTGNGVYGVAVVGGSSNNVIGGLTPADRNLISGNTNNGIAIFGSGVTGNVVQGNYIGLDVTGSEPVRNAAGVSISDGANGNTVGGAEPGARNLISGNQQDGVGIFRDPATAGNVIQGNYIGTDIRGSASVPNGTSGVSISEAANNNAILGNVISGNTGSGVALSGAGTTANVVQGNFVGINAAGTRAVANSTGLSIGATGNLIGGTTPEARNVISGNLRRGVNLTGTGNVVQGNFIGTDASGRVSIPNGNGFSGLALALGASNNTVGGTDPGAGNVISGNTGGSGVSLLDGASGNRVQGNYIGVDVTGSAALGNVTGVFISSGANNNLIGGVEFGAGNVISGNDFEGVFIGGLIAGTTGNVIQGNFLGTDTTGTVAVPNQDGVVIREQAPANLVGGTAAGAGNLISGNLRYGVVFFNTTGTRVQGNLIGTDVTGTAPLGNLRSGVLATGTLNGGIVGGTEDGAGNLIAFNGYNGVHVTQEAQGVAIRRNAILANVRLGIELTAAGNRNQAAPALTRAVSDGATVTVEGTLTSTPNTTFALEFFANAECDPSGFGEGERYLGTFSVTTGSGGAGSFTAVFEAVAIPGEVVTATATSPTNNTSAFSQCRPVDGAGPGAPWSAELSQARLLPALAAGLRQRQEPLGLGRQELPFPQYDAVSALGEVLAQEQLRQRVDLGQADAGDDRAAEVQRHVLLDDLSAAGFEFHLVVQRDLLEVPQGLITGHYLNA